MPTQLHLEFFADRRRTIPGGIYVISSPESKVYRPNKGFKKAYKVGSSWDLGKRLNTYLLSFPFDNPGLEIEGALLMNLANTKGQQSSILQCERAVHSVLHKKYKADSYYPGFGNGQRLDKSRVEWYEGVPLRVIFNAIEEVQREFGGVFCEGNENYAHKWRQHLKPRALKFKIKSK